MAPDRMTRAPDTSESRDMHSADNRVGVQLDRPGMSS